MNQLIDIVKRLSEPRKDSLGPIHLNLQHPACPCLHHMQVLVVEALVEELAREVVREL